MKAEGRERALHGFVNPSNGWHIAEIQEGIAPFEVDGVLQTDKKGAQKYIIPFKINDPEDEANGAILSLFPAANDRGEQTVADVLAAAGLYAKFAEKFPGDVSVFDKACFEMIKIKVPGQFVKIRTQINKGKNAAGEVKEYANIVETASMSFNPEKEEKEKTNNKGGKGKAEEKKETKKNDSWD